MQFNFDATGIDTSDDRSFEPLPKGKYNAMVVESTLKDTKAGTGKFIELVCQIIDGQYMNRKIWWRLNIVNPNKVAEDIGRKDLATLMANLGLGAQMGDTQELHGKPFAMGLKIRQSEGYEPSNDVTFTAAVSGPVAAPAMAPPNGRPQPQQTAAASAPPWG
jgi:hypothetical protein